MLAFRLYQVEVNHEDEPVTFSKVSGTERAHGEDFVVEEEGKIKRSVEWKNGIYRLDSIDATVSGLPETYFKGYERPNQDGDTPYRPFVFEMREGAEGDAWASMSAVFHGIVDPNSIQYTQRTGRTKFEVWSWDAVLTQQSDIPARSVVEVDVVEGVDSESILDGNPSLRVPDTQKVEEGDVVEVEQDGITRRSTIEDIDGRNDEDISISLTAPSLIPQEEIEQANPVEFLLGGSFPHNTDGVGADTSMLGFEPTEALKTAIQNKQSGTSFSARIYNTKTGKEKKLESPELVDVDPVDTVSTGRGLIWLATPTKVPSAYYEDVYENPPELSTQNENVYVDIEYANPVESGKTVKVYGRSVYGYDSTFTANVQNDRLITFHPDYNVAYVDSDGNPDGLIPAIFSIGGNDQLDLLRAAVDRFEIDEGAQYKEIDRRKVFPDDIEKSLRAIQRTANLFLAIEPVTSADGTEPRIKVRVIARDDISGMAAEDGSAYIVEDWDEDVIEQKVDAVKVTTHKPAKPSPNYGDVVGWYPAEKNHRFAVLGHNINSDNRDEFVVRGDQSSLLSPGDTFDLRDGDRNQITSFTVFDVYRTDVDEANNRSHVVVEEAISDSHDQQNYIFFRAPGKIEPEGAKVVEIKTVARPAFQGEGSADKTNDNRLSELAERFFRFYEEQGVQGKATITVPVDGTPRGLVGSKITFPEPEDASGKGRTVFVTSAEYDRETGKAQIEFRRGDYTEPTGPAVEARANVPSSLRSPGKVVFNGDPSIAQAGADYEWEITSSTNGNVTTGVFGKGRSTTLDLPEGTHNWKLTVTGPEGGTDTTSGTITVKTVGSGLNDPAEIRTDAYEQDPGGSSVREAVLEVDVEAEGGTPEEIEFYVAEGKSIPEGAAPTRTVTSVSNGGTYTETASLSEGHVTTMQAVAIYSDRSVRRSQAYTYDANAVPAPSYSWNWEYDSGADTYDLYLSWKGSTDTASIEVDFDEGADGTVDNTAIANGRNGRVKVNSSAIDTNKTVEINPVSYNGADQSGVAETNPPTYTITSPFGASEVSGSDDLDSRYVLENGDSMAGPLQFGSAGEIAEGSGSYLEVLAADGTNSGVLHLDTLVVDQLDVTGDINQKNETNLAVEDRWIEANVGGGDQDAGLIVNRSSTDAYLMWDEGTDLFGRRFGSDGTFEPFVLEDGTRWEIDIGGDADTVDQYGGNDLAVLDENETITAGWIHEADITLDGAYIQTSGAATGFSGSGTVINDDKAWFDNIAVRESLFASQFEIRKLRFSKGPRADTVGGGKIAEFTSGTDSDPVVADGNGWAYVDVRFEEEHGFKDFNADGNYNKDRVAAIETDPSKSQNSNTGSQGHSIIREVRGHVHDVLNPKKARIYLSTDNVYVTPSTYENSRFSVPQVGDDLVVVASGHTDRDSMLWYDPYGPFLDVHGGINSWSEWSNRTPKVRLGYLNGAPNLSDGTSPDGYGLYGENVYLEGTIVANSGNIAEFNINSDNIKKNYNDGKLMAGVLDWAGPTTGFGFNGEFGEVQIGERSGMPNFLAYKNPNNYVEIGAGYRRDDMGITVKARDNKVFYTDPNTAYIDNLEIRNGATIDGGVTVSGGFSGDQIEVTDLSAVDTSTGSLDVDGTLTMNGGKITNGGSDFRIDQDGIEFQYGNNLSNKIVFRGENDYTAGELYALNDTFKVGSGPFTLMDIYSGGGIDISGNPLRLRGGLASEFLRVVSIPNTQSYGQEGVGIVFTPYKSNGSGNADKSDLEDAMGPNEGMVYAMRYPDGNINLAWAETDSNGNIQNRGNTF